jgi:hypothetical protein
MNVDDANELIAASQKGEVITGLQSYVIEDEPEEVDDSFGNVVGQESLTRFDEAKRRRKKRRPSGKGRGQSGAPKAEPAASKGPESQGGGSKPSRRRGRRKPNSGNKGGDNKKS